MKKNEEMLYSKKILSLDILERSNEEALHEPLKRATIQNYSDDAQEVTLIAGNGLTYRLRTISQFELWNKMDYFVFHCVCKNGYGGILLTLKKASEFEDMLYRIISMVEWGAQAIDLAHELRIKEKDRKTGGMLFDEYYDLLDKIVGDRDKGNRISKADFIKLSAPTGFALHRMEERDADMFLLGLRDGINIASNVVLYFDDEDEYEEEE